MGDLFGGDVSNLELSPKNGEGEGSMSILIQKSMSSILGPVAERVMELEEKARETETLLKDLAERENKAVMRLDGHDQKVAMLNADIARANEDLRITNDSVGEAHEKHAAMENDHDVTRSLANRTESSHKNTTAALSDLNRSHEQLDSQVRQLQLALSETNIAHLNINDRMTELRNRHEGLNDRHLDVVKSVQETKQGDENTRQALKRFTGTFDKQRKEDQRSFQALDDRSKNFEAGLVEAQHQLDLLNKVAKGNKTELDRLKSGIDSLAGVQHGLQQDRGNAGKDDLQGRIGKLEESIGQISKIAQQEKSQTLGIVQAMADTMHKNTAQIQQNMGVVEGLDKGVKGHEHRLHKAEEQVKGQIANQQRMKEQQERMESDLRGNIAGVQREAKSQLDTQAHEIAKTNATLLQAQQRADNIGSTLTKVNGDLGATQAQLSKLGSSVDLAHEYVSGLAKGFQDTHKRVASGSDGMLGPRQGGARKLPPVTPRAPSAP